MAIKRMTEEGSLRVRVSTAGEAFPLAGAIVKITGEDPENQGLIFVLTSDIDGITETVSLPTPSADLSLSPGGEKPFASYRIEVTLGGYYRQIFQNVPVFSGILSVQKSTLIPFPLYNPGKNPPSRPPVVEGEALWEAEA